MDTMVEDNKELHVKLVSYLAKRSEKEAISALDNLVLQGLIGKREYKQLAKRIIYERSKSKDNK